MKQYATGHSLIYNASMSYFASLCVSFQFLQGSQGCYHNKNWASRSSCYYSKCYMCQVAFIILSCLDLLKHIHRKYKKWRKKKTRLAESGRWYRNGQNVIHYCLKHYHVQAPAPANFEIYNLCAISLYLLMLFLVVAFYNEFVLWIRKTWGFFSKTRV